MKEFLKSRFAIYLISVLTYYFWWKVCGFDFAVIIALGTIIGEMIYLAYKNNT